MKMFGGPVAVEGEARFLAKKIMAKRRTAEGIYHQVYKKVISNEARLPSLPDVAQKVRRAVADDSVGVKEMARIIQADPPLATRIIRTANSPLYRSSRPYNNVADAVKRMGGNATRNVVYSHSLRALFNFREKVLRDVSSEIWQDSVQTAAIASVLAVYCHGVSPDKAMLAGLIQDIGALPLLAELSENYPDVAKDYTEVKRVVNAYKSEVGYHLVKLWGFDEEFIGVMKSREDWMREGGAKLDLSDVILLSRWHAAVGTPSLRSMPHVVDMPAYKKFPVNKLSPEKSLEVLENAKEQMEDISNMLGSGPKPATKN
ncbi:MAG: HDOD domain-containing protein [Pseudomonadales bacterium]|nr:HDOD domain-containing protein [Pseudomonadales bacterium]